MLYPMAAMVLLTVIVAILVIRTRMKSVKSGDVKARFYKLMQGQEVPELVVKTGRNYNNQFELPVLFYAAGILHIQMQAETQLAVTLAWAFVVLRYLHSFIHITYNHVLHRMLTFAAGFACLIALWVNLMLAAQ